MAIKFIRINLILPSFSQIAIMCLKIDHNYNNYHKVYNVYKQLERRIYNIIYEGIGTKTAQVTIFSDFLKYWEISGFFVTATLFPRLMVHSK